MMENIQLDENDINEIIEDQRKLLTEYQDENDVLKEEKRLLMVKNADDELLIQKLKEQIINLGGEVDEDG